MNSRELRCASPSLGVTGLLARRDLLRIGSLGIAGTLLPGIATAELARASNKPRARSVILLWMAGGMTHIDSFDPKPDAPEEVRGTLSAIDTALPGVRFTEVMPTLARSARHLAVVRTFASDNNDHFFSQAYTLSGRKITPAQITTEPNVGSIVAKLRGGRNGFPGYVAIPGTTRPGPPPKNLFTGGWLGMQFAPFSSGGTPRNADFTAKVAEASEDQFNQQCLRLPVDIDLARLAKRQTLRESLGDSLGRLADSGESSSLGQQFDSAFTMLTAPSVRAAFDLTKEADTVRDAYGRTKIGQRCLLARRLVEAGAPFVMVDYGYDPEFGNLWDNHRVPEQNQPHISEMCKLPHHLAGTDRAAGALVDDLAQRGLLDETLVVLLTEFGRTPKINKLGGRDHWGPAGSIFFAGGGTQGGQVIGATDKEAAYPITPRYSPCDVAATIYQAIGIQRETLLHDSLGRPIAVCPDGQPIPGVL